MTTRASSNRASLFCAVCASLGTVSLRNRSTDSMLSDSFPSCISTSRKRGVRSPVSYFLPTGTVGGCAFQKRDVRTLRCSAKCGSRLPERGRGKRDQAHAWRDGVQQGRDERPEREDPRERVEQVPEPAQDAPLCGRALLLLLQFHLLERVDERGEVGAHLRDVLQERAGGRGDVVRELRRVRAVSQAFEPRLGRAVDAP